MHNRLQPLAFLFGIVVMLLMSRSYSASAPLAPLPLPDNAVHDLYVSNGRVYLAGSFTLIDGSGVRYGLAAIDVATGTLVSSWTPSLGNGVGGGGTGDVLLPSADGKMLFVGGSFADVDGVSHNLIAAINIDIDSTSYGQVSTWDPQLIGNSVLTLALSPVGTTLYIGGDFTAAGSASLPRQNLAAIDTTSAVTLPWAPDPDGIVNAILSTPDGSRIYVAGEFATIGSSDGRDNRTALAALNPGNAAAQAWDAALTGTSVNAMVLSADATYLTIGGQFTKAGTDARVNLARLDATSAVADSTWIADTDGPVYALVQTANGDVFVGGAFGTIQGVLNYHNLAMIRGDTLTVTPWLPQIGTGGGSPRVYSLAVDTTNDRLLVGGDYADIGGNIAYQYLADYLIEPPVTVNDSNGVYASQLPRDVNLDCTDQSGGPCAETYYAIDAGGWMLYTGTVTLAQNAVLHYFSIDGDGNREDTHSVTYFIDLMTAPQTTASPAQGTLNAATYVPLELICNDGAGGSGCASTYYTLDGSTPTTASSVYSTPIDLLPNGDTTVRYFSVDKAGNVEAVQSQLYKVDQDLPTINVSHDSGNYLPPLDVTIICDDGSGTGCDQIYLTTDGSDPTDPTDPVTPFTYTGPITLTLSSASILRIVASDIAGNSGSSIVGIYTFTDPSPIKRHGSGAIDGVILVLLALLALCRLCNRISGENDACR